MSGAGRSISPTHGWTLRAVRHELRTPLNAVLGLSEALLGDVDGPLTEGQRENLTIIAATARRLSDLFDDVLELSTDTPTDRFRTREAVDLGSVLDELAEALEQSRGARPVHVRVVTAPELAPALANPHRLQRLVGSVGRYALSTCTAELLELRACCEGTDRMRIEVLDPARTLNEAEVRTLLSDEPSPLRRRGLDESARLRLSMFRQLTEREGGSFSFDSDAAGTRMSIVLPTAAVSPSEPPPPSDASTGVQQAATVESHSDDIEQLRARFVAAMGHDLRGPLNTILGFSELLVMEEHDAVAPDQRPAVDHIRQSAHDLLSLLDNTLDWARLEAGQLALDRLEVTLDEALAEACAQAALRSGARGLAIELGGERARSLRVHADRERVVQALLGLLDHAVRSDGNPTVALRAELMGGGGGGGGGLPRARVTIEDPGLRVRDQDQPAFFEAFRPSFEPSGRRLAGLGIGPAVARALIRAHGGDVWFTSDAERGTTFTLELPTC